VACNQLTVIIRVVIGAFDKAYGLHNG